jgi:HK97 family phage portal protein
LNIFNTLTSLVEAAIYQPPSKKAFSDDFADDFMTAFRLRPGSVVGPKSMGELLQCYKGSVYSAISARAEATASMKLRLYDKNDKEVEKHVILDILKDGNPDQTFYDIILSTQTLLDLLGECYWYLPKSILKSSKYRQIFLLRPDLMRSERDSVGTIVRWIYRNGGSETALPVDEIIQFSAPNPSLSGRGFSPLNAGMYSYEIWEKMQQWNRQFFYNSATPDGVIIDPGRVEPARAKEIRTVWEETFGGVENSHKIAVVGNGGDFKAISSTPKDLDFAAAQNQIQDAILSTYRVSKVLIGLVSDSNRANSEAAEYSFAKNVVVGLVTRFTNTLNKRFVTLFDNSGLYLQADNVVPEDIERKIKIVAVAKDVMTINEIRKLAGLDAIDGGDEIYKPTSATDMANLLSDNSNNNDSNQKKNIVSTKNYTFEQKNLLDLGFDITVKHTKSANPPSREDTTKKKEILESVLERKMRRYFKDLEQKLEVVEKSFYIDVEPIVTEQSELKKLINSFYTKGGRVMWDNFDRYFQENLSFDSQGALREIIATETQYFAKEVTKTTLNDFSSLLYRMHSEGATVQDVKKEVKKLFNEYYTNRAKTIALTETANIQNAMSWERMKKSGQDKLRWRHLTGTKFARMNHSALDGEVISLSKGETFQVGRYQARYPHDPSLSADETVNCRCDVEPYFD